ncbi:hypothetical protein OSB04_002320 [Centaurea solstitialis]|uniref:Cystatin domain-containing protein n=1 Tax=Centaurea solstitialis TaxID=347529 RepID=A0AA38TT50_9ASTR|nr:hypothetical protein OSB04_002320 [Centaurea solstitialis]
MSVSFSCSPFDMPIYKVATPTPPPLVLAIRVNGVGAWDIEQHYLKELGKFAVAAHNLKTHHEHQLTFQKVISCDHLSELNHKLTIAASEGGITHTYEAVVSYKPWIQLKKLISFKIA